MGRKMSGRRCVIVGSAPVRNVEELKALIRQDDFILCADGGLTTAIQMQLRPDLVIGDFDSFSARVPEDVETIVLPVNKDDTDMMYSIKEALRRGFSDFLLMGGIGGRLDHTVANLCALQYLAQQNALGVLADGQNEARIVLKGKYAITYRKDSILSVFPFGAPFCTVSYEGLEYPLTNAKLYSDNPMGTSNRVLGDCAVVEVHSGPAMIILTKENAALRN
jgi:thiamine pyrophosphokinase